jgi:2-polyprenyl-6-methoxyphenol hydroxylase-like FAD-dependent oxidoreductase
LQSISVDGDTVTATFRDGSSETGNIAIGCDGSHSKVREFLVGPEAAALQFVDLTMINFPQGGYAAEDARLLQTMHPIFKIAAHPHKPGNGILAGEFLPLISWQPTTDP